jgi:hypothetical protein
LEGGARRAKSKNRTINERKKNEAYAKYRSDVRELQNSATIDIHPIKYLVQQPIRAPALTHRREITTKIGMQCNNSFNHRSEQPTE